MKKNFEAKNLIMNSRFIHLYEDANEDKKEFLLKRVEVLSNELTKYKSKEGNLYLYFCNITTSIASLEYDLAHGVKREDSINEIKRYMEEFMQPQKEQYQRMFQKRWLWPILRHFIPKAITKVNGEGFHCYTYKNKNKNLIVFYSDRCMFNDVLRKREMLDLAKTFCYMDKFMYSEIPGVKFVRLGTLCENADKCDFTFEREHK